jgi:lysophospholipase L1-like esterase
MLLLFGIVVGASLSCMILRCLAWRSGLVDREVRYESEIAIWRPDAELGFANARNFSGTCHGIVRARTDRDGFRGGAPVSRIRIPGSLRIMGLGDSVMWGTGVDEEQALLGILRSRLRRVAPSSEVINAGVVGYSTLQEALLLERLLPEFSPDVVLVNFCENDLLPTEDPYRSMRDLHLRYLRARSAGSVSLRAGAGREALEELLQVFASSGSVHEALTQSSAGCRALAFRMLLELPIRRMARLARTAQSELVFLLIPPRDGGKFYHQIVPIVRQVLDEEAVACIDVAPELLESAPILMTMARQDPAFSARVTMLGHKWLPDLRAIQLVWRNQAMHRKSNYIDRIHPSRKGNAIIAGCIFRYLAETGRVPADAGNRPGER